MTEDNKNPRDDAWDEVAKQCADSAGDLVKAMFGLARDTVEMFSAPFQDGENKEEDGGK